ncbi:antitoxin MazE-like protein [Geomonas subterranea]|uniref:Antitoxin MazE family protein n=1 Tax=Geomonas subterranea TaxID=2847989 RepID=A0ABX8LNL4_9BACT|nr:antitoxin MazE family protein [Geomonas subterranea]QXM11653.1 antitoxin MazE family protein [Geomonas subterranea]
MCNRNRVQDYRTKLPKAGVTFVHMWIPDASAPGFPAECLRQSGYNP